MSERLREAARSALGGLDGPVTEAAPGEVDAASFAVSVQGRRELVSLRLTDRGIAAACTCGAASTGAPSCQHATLALRMLAGAALEPSSEALPSEDRLTTMLEPAMRLASPVPGTRAAASGQDATAALASALEDVIGAVLRSGTNAGVSAAVAEALERVASLSPAARAPAARVFIGALKTALESRNAGSCVRALEGARSIVASLRGELTGEDARLRLSTFVGDAAGGERISERALIELAREWKRGVERAGIERRYLLDLGDGQLYREDGAVSESSSSLGPCPRAIQVGLAHIEAGVTPRRLKLFQYTTTPIFEPSLLEHVSQWAERSLQAVKERYARYASAFSGVAEPLALLAASRITAGLSPALVDEADASISLVASQGALDSLLGAVRDAEPLWVFGRLLPHGDELCLSPLAVCVRKLGLPRYAQL